MSLQKRTLDIPITKGINTNVSNKNLSVPDLLELRNGRFLKSGRIEKRFGYQNLGLDVASGSTIINMPRALTAIKDELILLSADRLYTYSEALDNWHERGIISGATTNMQVATASPVSTYAPDVAVQDGLKLIVWLENTTIYYSIFDVETGAIVIDRATLIASGASIYPRVTSLASYFYIFYNESTDMKCLRIPTSNPTGTSTTTIYNTLESTGGFDATSLNGFNYILFRVTGSSTLRMSKLSPELVVVATNTIAGEDPTDYASMCIHGFYSESAGDYRLAMGWVTSTPGLRSTLYDTNFVQLVAPQSIDSAADVVKLVIADDEDTLHYIYTISAADTKDYYTKSVQITLAGVASSDTVLMRSVAVVSRPAKHSDGVNYFNVLHNSTLQSTYFTLLLSGRVVAKWAAGLGGTHATTKRVSNFVAASTMEYTWGNLKRGRIQSENATLFATQAPYFATLSVDPANAYINTLSNGLVLIGGGALLSYDGRSVTEHGFHLFPEDVTVAQSGVSTPLAVGTYLISAIYEWTDNQGNRMQSAPSVAKRITTNGTASQIDVTVPALRVTDKSPDVTFSNRASVKIRVFITEASGTTFYYVAQADNPNILSTDSVAIAITSLTGITSNEILYTTSSELENIGAPAHKFNLTHDNRVFLLGLEDPNKIQFSKNIKTLTGMGFNEDFSITLDPFGGDIIAGASMDNNLVVFKETATYVIAGTGPNDIGQNSNYNPPQLVSSDIGCKDVKSLLVTPSGIIWKSNKGVYLMDRGLNMTPIGKPVKDYDSLTVLSGDILKDSDEIRLVTDGNITLVYNYFFKQWSVFSSYGAIDATTWKDSQYVYLTSTKTMLEDSTTYTDDGSYVPLTIRTGWMHFAGLQGYQRLYKIGLLGSYFTNNNFKLTFFYDYSDIPRESINIDASSVVNTSVYGDEAVYGDDDYYGGSQLDEVFQVRVDNPRQLCESMSLKITDASVGENNTGRGFSLEGLACTIGVKGGIFRNSPTRTF